MEGVLAQGSLGSVGKYDVAFKEGSLQIEIDANASFGSAGLVIKVGAGSVLDAIAKAIPGVWDDAAIALIKKALGV